MLQKLPIVIIDDDSDDRELLGELAIELRSEHELRFFVDGVDALKYLETTDEQPFIILCDVNMPKMNGLELLKEIQRTPYLKQKSVPFIFLSTSGEARFVTMAYELSAQGFFQKPSEIGELRSILKLTFDFWAKCLHPHHSQIDT
ncbi:MAG TPA: response regulator [Flavitalea sp.]|nr:response regulator [Flavitalea sp.]